MNAEARDVQEKAPPLVANPFSAPIVAAPTGAAAAALVQREVAEVQAAMVIAKAHPRDPRLAMDRILTACTRETLAENALYEYARGGQTVTGPSIRLAEELARQWGNILCGVTELARNAGSSECLAYAWDLETNFRDEKRFTVRHWRDTKKGGYAITDERDIYELIANMGARRKRACILAVIPGDVTEAAVRQCEMTMKTREEVTPERLKALVEAFAKFGVTKEQLEKRIQRHLDSITPALLVNLRKIYNSLKDGMSVPGDWFEMPEAAASSGPQTATAAVKEKLAQRQARKAGNAPSRPPEPASHVPIYDADTARDALEQATSVAALDKAWTSITDDFAQTERELPLELEALYNDLREALAERESLQADDE